MRKSKKKKANPFAKGKVGGGYRSQGMPKKSKSGVAVRKAKAKY